jgi:hypothetical protein
MRVFGRKIYACMWVIFFCCAAVEAQKTSPGKAWAEVELGAAEYAKLPHVESIAPAAARAVFQLDLQVLKTILLQSPVVNADAVVRKVRLYLPLPAETFLPFDVRETSTREPKLAADNPQLRSYEARSTSDSTLSARLDVTPSGFYAVILSQGSSVYIDPAFILRKDAHLSYVVGKEQKELRCVVSGTSTVDFREIGRSASQNGNSG